MTNFTNVTLFTSTLVPSALKGSSKVSGICNYVVSAGFLSLSNVTLNGTLIS